MREIRIADAEYRFTQLVWDNEPIPSGALVKLCEQEFNWKKSTTYTVLKRLCERGILKNENSTVTSLIKEDEYNALKSEQFVETTFGGSLPRFIAAFMSRKNLNEKQINEIRKMIDEYGKRED